MKSCCCLPLVYLSVTNVVFVANGFGGLFSNTRRQRNPNDQKSAASSSWAARWMAQSPDNNNKDGVRNDATIQSSPLPPSSPVDEDDLFFMANSTSQGLSSSSNVGYQFLLQAKLEHTEEQVKFLQERLDMAQQDQEAAFQQRLGKYFQDFFEEKKELTQELEQKNKELEEYQLDQQLQQTLSLEGRQTLSLEDVDGNDNGVVTMGFVEDLMALCQLQQVWVRNSATAPAEPNAQMDQDGELQVWVRSAADPNHQKANDALNEETAALQDLNMKLQDQLNEREDELAQTQAELQDAIATSKAQEEESEENLMDLVVQIRLLQQRRSDAEALADTRMIQQIHWIMAAMNFASELESSNTQLKSQNSELQALSMNLQHAQESWKQDKERLQQAQYDKTEGRDQLEKQNRNLEARLLQAMKEKGLEQSKRAGIDEHATKLEESLSSQSQQLSKVQAELQAMKRKEQAWTKAKSDMNDQLATAQSTAQQEQRQAESYRQELANTKDKIQQLEANLKSIVEENKQLSKPPPPPRAATVKTQKQKIPEIRQWSLNELGEVCGVVYHHEFLEDGSDIITSVLSHPKLAGDYGLVETQSGSVYRLGKQQPAAPAAAPEPKVAKKPLQEKRKQPPRPSFPNILDPANRISFFNQQNNSTAASSHVKTPVEEKKKKPTPAPAKKTPAQQPKPVAKVQPQKVPRPSFPNIFTGRVQAPPRFGGGSHNNAKTAEEQETKPKEKKAEKKKVPSISFDLPLTGESLGGGRYLLAGTSKSSTNGRCNIAAAYVFRKDKQSQDLVTVKTSTNTEAMQREHDNYKKLWSGQQKGVIVKCHDYFRDLKDGKSAALILERGEEDLKARRQKGFEKDELKAALLAAAKCLDSFHSTRMVWTDLKSENFVSVKSGDHYTYKAIDLESAQPAKGNPLDYTPEACPPEFARAFLEGEPHDFVLDYSYDIWSFGMMAYELASSQGGYFDKIKHREQIIKRIAACEIPNVEADIDDPDLADLILQCLEEDPKKRPHAQKILRNPYFKKTTAANNNNHNNNFFGLSF